MTIGVLWELFEFAADRLLLPDMQKDTVITQFSGVLPDPADSNTPILMKDVHGVAINGESLRLPGYPDNGLFDTMKDPFINMLGAFNFALISFFRPAAKKQDISPAVSYRGSREKSDTPEGKAGKTSGLALYIDRKPPAMPVNSIKATPHNPRHASCLYNIPSYRPKILGNTQSITCGFWPI